MLSYISIYHYQHIIILPTGRA